ncbi:MAG: monovalent cation/H+ antiporter complex subunit F [Desulfovermiculus sp.]
MNLFYLGMALFLLLNILIGLYRVYAGPKPRDRMVAAQLFGTTGVATLLLLAQALHSVYIKNAALVFALLMVMAVLAFVRTMSPSIDRDPDR